MLLLFLPRLSEQEELSQEQMRLASSLKVRAQCLEDDNNTLNQRLEALTKQKYHLEKVMKELQLEKEKEVMFLFKYMTSLFEHCVIWLILLENELIIS